jgi:hypothetical protein
MFSSIYLDVQKDISNTSNDVLFAVIMGSFPPTLYFIFALSNKRGIMIVRDVPVYGRAIQELYLSSVSTARN